MLVTKGMPRGHLAALTLSFALLIGTSFYIAMTGDRGASGALTAALIMVIIIPIVLASSAKAPAASVLLPERRVTLETAMQPDAVFAKLAPAKFGKVAPHDTDANRRVVVFSSPMSGWSYGFFYAVFIRGAGAGSIVEIGIMPKSIECRTRVEKALAACVADVKKTVAA